MVLAIFLSFLIALANYVSEKFVIRGSRYKNHIISLVAGISVAYLFLHLLPELYEGVINYRRSLFVFVLVGFATFHVIEKFIYQHVGKGRISETLKLNHSIGILLYDFSVGIVLVSFLKASTLEGLLFFIPVFSHTALSNLSIHKIHGLHHHKEQIIESASMRIFLAGGAIYGSLLTYFYSFSLKITYTLTGLVAGILLFIVIREILPKDKEGNPLMFIIGVLLYSLLIFWLWVFP